MGSGVFTLILGSVKSMGVWGSRVVWGAVPEKVCVFLTRKRVRSTDERQIEDAETWEIGISQIPAFRAAPRQAAAGLASRPEGGDRSPGPIDG